MTWQSPTVSRSRKIAATMISPIIGPYRPPQRWVSRPLHAPVNLATYVAAAILARSADGGVVVAVVLLVTLSGGSGALLMVAGALSTGARN